MLPFRILFFLTFGVVLSSCYKDKGNYTYHDINEIGIDGLNASYSVITGVDMLRIEPKVTMTEQTTDPARFAYYWIVIKGTTVVDTISRQAILDYKASLAPDSYVLFFRIVDKATGVAWKKSATLTVGTPYSRGIMLMGTNEAGNAEAQMISMVKDTLIVSDILAKSGLPTLKDPVAMVHTGTTLLTTGMRLWAFTKSGSYYFDRLTMKATAANTFGSIMYTTEGIDKTALTPVLTAPQVISASGTSGNSTSRAVLCSDGSLFAASSYLNGGDFYTNPVNREAGNFSKMIKAAPFLFYSIANMSSVVWYDVAGDRFMNYTSFGLATTSAPPVDVAGTAFPWDQQGTGRKLVYGENTRNTDGGSANGNSFAIMKDGANKCFIYKFYANGTIPAKRDFYEVPAMATDFDKASFYAFSSKRTVVFYVVGNKLYAYDYNRGYEKAYSFPQIGADEITMLKFDTQIDFNTNSLYIATYNAQTKGTLRRYSVGSNPDVVEITPVDKASWSGLLKIKDMNWRGTN